MVAAADHNYCGAGGADAGRLHHVALQAEVGSTGLQHLWVHRTVYFVANGTTIAHRFMLEGKWARLRSMAGSAGVAFSMQCGTASDDSWSGVRIMASGAGHIAIHDRVGAGKVELAAQIGMALEARLG